MRMQYAPKTVNCNNNYRAGNIPPASGIEDAVSALRHGGVVAYPTEAVYGLGCDAKNPVAIKKLLAIKQRDAAKGLILIAADFAQLSPYLQTVDPALAARAQATWPGPVTWLWPTRHDVSELLRGAHDTLAVRVTAHAVAAQLCAAFGGALVSTSANISGQAPACTADEAERQFGKQLDSIVVADVGGQPKPSEIRHLLSGKVIRAGEP